MASEPNQLGKCGFRQVHALLLLVFVRRWNEARILSALLNHRGSGSANPGRRPSPVRPTGRIAGRSAVFGGADFRPMQRDFCHGLLKRAVKEPVNDPAGEIESQGGQ